MTIIGNPQILLSMPEEKRQAVVQEAVEKYLGLESSRYPGLKTKIKTAAGVIDELGENAQVTRMILTQGDLNGVTSNNGAFIYVPQAGELLRDAITVTTEIDFNSDGKFTERSRDIILDYLKKQIPGIDSEDVIWQEINSAINSFNNSILFFSLPNMVKFTKRLNDLTFYRITILIMA